MHIAATMLLHVVRNTCHTAILFSILRYLLYMNSDAVEGHFLRKFGWGNKTTLQTEPEANGVDVCTELRAFYDQHYHPSNCKLVLLSPYSLERMEQEAILAFGQWQARTESVPVPVPVPAIVSGAGGEGGESECIEEGASDHYITGIKRDNLVDEPAIGRRTLTSTAEEKTIEALAVFAQVFGSSSAPTGTETGTEAGTAAQVEPTRVYRIRPMRRNYHWVTLAWLLPPTLRMFRYASSSLRSVLSARYYLSISTCFALSIYRYLLCLCLSLSHPLSR